VLMSCSLKDYGLSRNSLGQYTQAVPFSADATGRYAILEKGLYLVWNFENCTEMTSTTPGSKPLIPTNLADISL